MVSITYDNYDKLLEYFEKIKAGEKVPPYWPTVGQIDMFDEDPEKWLQFCCYLYEFNPEPSTPEERYSKKNLAAFIHHNLELIE